MIRGARVTGAVCPLPAERGEGIRIGLAARGADAAGSDVGVESADDYEQPLVVPQLTHLWQLPLGIMIDPHSGQVGASVRAMKL